MITTNIDVADGLVNGSIGILRHFELLPGDAREDESPVYRMQVWLEFEPSTVGRRARLKHRPRISASAGCLDASWTPITFRSVSISPGNQLKCRRIQLPISPACAITIHKSQGGTFNSAVVCYDKSQQTQLVYVAFSRVTSIEELYIINKSNDHIFYHKRGSTAPSLREVRDEYARLSLHPLVTLTRDVAEVPNSDIVLTAIIWFGPAA